MLSSLNEWYGSVQKSVNEMEPEQKTKIKAVGVGLVAGYIIYKIHSIGCWKYKVPNPSIPIIFHSAGTGTLLWILQNKSNNFHPKFTAECLRLIKQTGEKFVIWGGPKLSQQRNYEYLIFCPKIIKLIFEDRFTDFIKGPHVKEPMEPLLGNGIFASDWNDGWKFHRKVASRMFSLNNLKNYMFQCSVDNADILVEKMKQLSFSANNSIMDLWEMFGRYTLQSFLETAFGESTDIIQLLPKTHSFCTAFDLLVNECQARYPDPFWRTKRRFGIGEREGVNIPNHAKILADFADGIIKRRMKSELNRNIMDEDREKHDLLSLFMKYNKQEKQSQISNLKDIRDITMNFVIAARDTTRILLSFFFFEITKKENQHILNKLYEEIDQYKGETLVYNDCIPNAKSIKINEKTKVRKYGYLESVLMETLRMYPPVPFLSRLAVKDTVIPYRDFNGNNKTLQLLASDGVMVYTCAYLRLPQLWGPNADIFDPSRFVNGLNSYDMYKFPVFNVNPRLCLGKTAAIMQAKVMAISILRKYEIVPQPNQDIINIPLAPILVMKQSDGFKIKIKPRT